MSPAGQVDAVGDKSLGWRTNRSGRGRALRMLLWLAVAVAVAVVVAVGVGPVRLVT